MSFHVTAFNNDSERFYTNSEWNFLVQAMFLVAPEALPEKKWDGLCFNGPWNDGEIDAEAAIIIADKLDGITDEQLCSIPTYCGRTHSGTQAPWPVTPEELPWFREHVRKWAAFLRTSGGIYAG